MTYVIFFGVISLITLLSARLWIDGSFEERHPVEAKTVKAAKSTTFEDVMDCINIGVASQGFVISLFPIYCDMTSQARPKVLYSVFYALMFCFAVYAILGLVSIEYYGLANIEQNIFDNLKTSDDIFSILLRIVFLQIFLCAIPFIFFAGKLSILAIAQKCTSEDEIPEWKYFTICFVFLVSICVTAIAVEDLTIVFGLMSGLSEVMVVFIFPAWFYL